ARRVVPAGLGLRAALVLLVRYLVVLPVGWFHRWVLAPVGQALAWCGRVAGWCARVVVTGIGTALYWTGRTMFVLPALALWRWVLAPVGRVLAVVGREAGAALWHAWRIAG
ncbi:hypothetical protein NGM37_06500, partial [Streptomyces sp. TRM76130]|nr:hypothetical protein [Streptomyces sp. TRM76130]